MRINLAVSSRLDHRRRITVNSVEYNLINRLFARMLVLSMVSE